LTVVLGAACADNLAPVFDPAPGDRVVRVGQRIRFLVQAVDRDGGRVQFGARGLPPGSAFDRSASPPIFSWAPLASDGAASGRPHPVTFLAVDDEGATTAHRIVLTVFSGNTTPTFTSPASYPLGSGEPLDVLVTVRDDDSTVVNLTLVEGPAGATLAPAEKSARLLWRPSPDQLARRRVWGFTVNAWDEDPSRSSQQVITVVVHD
jgi:hypothetical protein